MSAPTYETRTLRGNGPYLIQLFAEGFKRCGPCGHMIKCDGSLCPHCNAKLSIRLATLSVRETQEKIAEFLKHGLPTSKRTCSRCGGSRTRQKQGANGPIRMWLKDGKGGYLCYGCYDLRRKGKAF